MSLLASLMALLTAAAPAPPTVSLEASAEAVVLTIANPRAKPLTVADSRDVDGLPYSLMFIKVLGPDGQPVFDEHKDGWWSPTMIRSPYDLRAPQAWAVAAGGVAVITAKPTDLTRGLDGPIEGTCRFQARAVIRDRDAWPWNEGGAYEAESGWVTLPCAKLF